MTAPGDPAWRPVPGEPGPLAGHPLLEPSLFEGLTVLEADAGTGKTWTICRLVVRAIVEHDLDLDSIAVLTFTNAAAAELRARIASLLDELLAGHASQDAFFSRYRAPIGDDQVRARLRLARVSLDGAMIGTIHGFCHRVLTDYGLSLGRWDEIEPSADGGESLERVVTEWWIGMLESGDPRLRWLLEGPRSRGAGGVSRAEGLRLASLRSVLAALVSDPRADVWPSCPDGDWRVLATTLQQAAAEVAEALRQEREQIERWREASAHVNRKSLNAPRLATGLDAVGRWLRALPGDLDQPPKALFDLTPAALAQKAVPSEEGGRELRRYGFFTGLERLADALARRAALPCQVARVILPEIRATLDVRHRRAGVLPFDALLTAVSEGLEDETHGPALAERLRRRYRLALVDEFQDTDPVQWRIFESIYAPAVAGRTDGGAAACGLVLVGDPKQSIYRFRNADVHTYLNAAARAAARFRLNANQRASAEVVSGLNAIIRGERPFLLESIQYPGAVAAGRDGDGARRQPDDGRAATTLILLRNPSDPEEVIDKEALRHRAAAACAAEVARLLGRSDGPAPAEIAVLVRTAQEGGLIKRMLGRQGVSAVEISRDSVFGGAVATELHRLLCALADCDDPALAEGAAVTALVAIDEEAVGAEAVADDARWRQDLVEAASLWHEQGAAPALHRLLFVRRAGAGRLAALPDGERRLTDLLHLVELLTQAEHAAHGPAQAARWLAARIARVRARAGRAGSDEPGMLRLESDAALVRIQTIHTSKGLEYPFVFLPFVWNDSTPPTNADSVVALAVSGAEGGRRVVAQAMTRDRQQLMSHLLRQIPEDAAGAHGRLDAADLKTIADDEAFAERLRLAYVALTRASRRITLCVDPGLGRTGTGGRSASAPERNVLAHWLAGDAGCAPEVFARALADLCVAPGVKALPWQAVVEGGKESAGASRPGRAGRSGDTLAVHDPVPVATAWTRRSFTGLMQESAEAGERMPAPDHDETWHPPETETGGGSGDDPLPASGPSPERDPAGRRGTVGKWADSADIRESFARGPGAGVCLHAILERHDFSRPLEEDEVRSHLARHGFDPSQGRRVADWLGTVLEHDLGPSGLPFRLRDIGLAESTRELPFLLGAGRVSNRRLSEIVSHHMPFDGLVAGDAWTGYLNGFIDVLARHEGRYWILDWKSNWLGDGAPAYGPEGLEAVVRGHGYAMQMALYALAVHRWLRARLPGYDYARDFGGVALLFLRGVADPRAQDPSTGVYSLHPPRTMIDALDEVFDPWPAS